MSHAVRVPVATEADDHQSFLLAHNSLIDMPACVEMGKDERHDYDEVDEGMGMVWNRGTVGVQGRLGDMLSRCLINFVLGGSSVLKELC